MADEATKTKEDVAEDSEEEEENDEEVQVENSGADEQASASVDLSDDAEEVVEQFNDLEEDQRCEAFLKIISESPVLWIKDLVDAMEERFGISTAAPAAAAAAPAAGAGGEGDGDDEEEEKAVVDVVLEDFGDQKIQVIKAVRGETDLGLKEAKSLVDDAPNPIKEGIPKEDAEEMKEEIEDAGAEVSLK